MDINTFQLKMLGKSLLKLTLITFAVAFIAAFTFFLALSLTLFTEKVVCKMVGDGEGVVDRTWASCPCVCWCCSSSG